MPKASLLPPTTKSLLRTAYEQSTKLIFLEVNKGMRENETSISILASAVFAGRLFEKLYGNRIACMALWHSHS